MSEPLGYGQSVLLGIVEGLTEFLPVSSTGHLTVVEKLLGLKVDDPSVTAYTAIIQFGAIVATFLYFRKDILHLATVWCRGVVSAEARRHADYRFAWSVLLGSMPIAVVGVVFSDAIHSSLLRNMWTIAAALILWSGVIFYAEKTSRRNRSEQELSMKEIIFIGLMQCVALIPGVSRSGATISAGLLVNADRVAATRLSFFLGIPALTGAGLLELREVDTSVVGWGQIGVGILVSFAVAYVSIAWLLKFVGGNSLTVFIGYRIAVGVAIIVLLANGVITAT